MHQENNKLQGVPNVFLNETCHEGLDRVDMPETITEVADKERCPRIDIIVVGSLVVRTLAPLPVTAF